MYAWYIKCFYDTCEAGFKMLSCDDIVRLVGMSEGDMDEEVLATKKITYAQLSFTSIFFLIIEKVKETVHLVTNQFYLDFQKKKNAAEKQKTLKNYFKI